MTISTASLLFCRTAIPHLRTIAQEILAKASVLEIHPALGYPVAQGSPYRQLVLRVAGAHYVFRYRLTGDRIVMLRVFHGREARDPH